MQSDNFSCLSDDNSHNNSPPIQIADRQYRINCYLLQLKEIQHILPKTRDVFNGHQHSSNYGLVRPLLREIYLEGQHALPFLSDYFDNNDYLYSVTGMYNMPPRAVQEVTLGAEARRLFSTIIDPTNANYKMRPNKNGELCVRPSFFYNELNNKTIKTWYQKNHTKSLLEIQREVVDFYIQKEIEIGFPDKASEKMYLTPLQELRTKLPITNQNAFNNPQPPKPTSKKP
jgi:hypothetical protein